jgi:hypothetical protein
MKIDSVELYCKKNKDIKRKEYLYIKILKEERNEKKREILIEKTISI